MGSCSRAGSLQSRQPGIQLLRHLAAVASGGRERVKPLRIGVDAAQLGGGEASGERADGLGSPGLVGAGTGQVGANHSVLAGEIPRQRPTENQSSYSPAIPDSRRTGCRPTSTTHYRTSTISKESRSIHDELASDPTTAAPRSRSSPRLLRPETARRTRRRCRPPGPGTSAAFPPDRLSKLSSGWASVSRPRTVCCPANSVTFRFACLAAERAHGALLV